MFNVSSNIEYQKGLTLIELMVVVAVSAILVGVVAPNVQNITNRNQVTSDINSTSAALRFARFTAVDQLKDVVVCPSANFATCNTADWDLAKIVFIDRNENGNRDANEALLHTTDKVADTNAMTAPDRSVIFTRTGTADQPIEINLCAHSQDNSLARQISINANGRVKLSRDQNGDGVHEADNGDALSCA
ncbi:MAG: GspH/FimT family pseudopilin [Pseudomonadota bacterium]